MRGEESVGVAEPLIDEKIFGLNLSSVATRGVSCAVALLIFKGVDISSSSDSEPKLAASSSNHDCERGEGLTSWAVLAANRSWFALLIG